ncbi:hypothetical protein HMPREF9137_1531 [Prevotella denticola F0289]|nr:hypothetical protein HMPREF9137_1531 [Prevotella denticola F0289]
MGINSISDGTRHTCREDRSVPVVIIYSKTMMTDLHVKWGCRTALTIIDWQQDK